MLDINLIRNDIDAVKRQLEKLYDPQALERLDAITELDRERRALLTEAEGLQQLRNRLNKNLGRLRGDRALSDDERLKRAAQAISALREQAFEDAAALIGGEPTAREFVPTVGDDIFSVLQSELGRIAEQAEQLYDQVKQVEVKLTEHMLWLPNLPHESVPVAESDEANVPHPMQGNKREYNFTPKPHWELGVDLNMIDFERGVKLAGARGYVLRGTGARLQTALTNLFLDHARRRGYEEMYLPFFVREEALIGAGQFPKFRDTVYMDPDAEVYMLPTAEVALTNFFADEILPEDLLPIKLVGHTPCFRRERVSAGRDVRGIKRVHQFQKVELFKFTTPETSYDELEGLTEDASDLLRALELPFRKLEIVTGDLGFSATKKYDLEVWSPGCEEWLEVSSISNTEAFQARRANIKYRPSDRKKTEFVHTLNGSGLALPRVIIAIMETYQRADGSIEVPAVLRPYLDGLEVIEPR
jgi:seryl-tRNA synthetase